MLSFKYKLPACSQDSIPGKKGLRQNVSKRFCWYIRLNKKVIYQHILHNYYMLRKMSSTQRCWWSDKLYGDFFLNGIRQPLFLKYSIMCPGQKICRQILWNRWSNALLIPVNCKLYHAFEFRKNFFCSLGLCKFPSGNIYRAARGKFEFRGVSIGELSRYLLKTGERRVSKNKKWNPFR